MLVHLNTKLMNEQESLRKLNAYMEGKQPLKFLALELKAEFGDRLAEIVINWCDMVANAYGDRLDLTGFSLPDSKSDGVIVDAGDQALWNLWEENDMVRQSQQAHLEAVALGRSYAIVGARGELDEEPAEGELEKVPNPFDEALSSPLITVESPIQVITEDDPRTRQPVAALKRWKDENKVDRATLYLAEQTIHYYYARKWIVADKNEHGLGVVPVVPLVNRQRMLDWRGKSEFEKIIPLADSANKMATDMMVSGEFHAMPRRYALGMAATDFVDDNGKKISAFEQIGGRLWATSSKPGDVELGTFKETDLAVFHNSLRLLADMTIQLAGLPQSYGYSKDNPPSADAMRASESRLVKGCERMQTGFGSSWRRVAAIATLIRDGEKWDPRILRATTKWRDAATPTVAQIADASVKKFQAGISTLRQTRIDCGYSPQEISRMEEEDAIALKNNPMTVIAREMSDRNPAGDGVPV